MTDAGETGAGWLRLCRRGADSWLAEICVEGWRIEWIPGSWMSHQRCAGWLGGKAEFPVA